MLGVSHAVGCSTAGQPPTSDAAKRFGSIMFNPPLLDVLGQ